MRKTIYLLLFLSLVGCAQSGYSPSYIISEAAAEEEGCSASCTTEEL